MTGRLLALALLLASGCSLALDLGTRQCKATNECLNLTEAHETYVCVAGLCQHLSCDPDKEGDAYCRAEGKKRGPSFATAICELDQRDGKGRCLPAECDPSRECEEGFVCDTAASRCVKESAALCPGGDDDACARYDALPICVDGHCVAHECVATKDCTQASPTAICRAGRCVDEVWGCIDEPVEEEVSTEPVTYQIEAYEVLSETLPRDVVVKLCGGPQDLSCNAPPPGATLEFDYDGGHIFVHGLAPGTRIHMQLSAEGMFTYDYMSQRVLRRKTEVEVAGIGLIPRSLIPVLASSTDTTTADLITNATAIVQISSCQDRRVGGVRISTSHLHRGPTGFDTVVFYISEGNHPDNMATQTFDYGAAGILNLDAGKSTKIEAFVGSRRVASHTMVPTADMITGVTLYPGVSD